MSEMPTFQQLDVKGAHRLVFGGLQIRFRQFAWPGFPAWAGDSMLRDRDFSPIDAVTTANLHAFH